MMGREDGWDDSGTYTWVVGGWSLVRKSNNNHNSLSLHSAQLAVVGDTRLGRWCAMTGRAGRRTSVASRTNLARQILVI